MVDHRNHNDASSLDSSTAEPLLNTRPAPNKCATLVSACRLLIRAALFSMTILLEGWFFWRFSLDFVSDQIEENEEATNAKKQRIIVCAI